MNNISLELSAVVFAIAMLLCVYIYKKDRVEKEPIRILIMLAGAGMLIWFPSHFGGEMICDILDRSFAGLRTFTVQGTAVYNIGWHKTLHDVLCAFLGIALPEEVLRLLALYLITHRSKQFNCLFDGIVYGAFIGVGFGAMQCLFYVWSDGWDMFVMRLFTSLPGQLLFGVLMGYLYTLWKVSQVLWRRGIQKRSYVRWNMTKALLLPVGLHGLYSFCGTGGTNIMQILFVAITVVMYGLCIGFIAKLSHDDCYIETFVSKYIEEERFKGKGGDSNA